MNIVSKLAFGLLITCLASYAVAQVSFDISGVKDSRAIDNINVFLKELSIPEDADNESYLQEVSELTKESLIALGYYKVSIETTVIGEIGKQSVNIFVDLGPRTKIVEIDLRLEGEAINNKLFQQLMLNFPIQEGQYLDHGEYESAKSRFSSLAQRYGFFDATYIKSNVSVSQIDDSATMQLWFDSGIRYQFGDLIFESDLPADKFITSLVNFSAGDPFDTNVLNEFNRDLNETGYFSNITILPEMTINRARQIPLIVIAKMRPEDSFNAGFGYSTDEGFRGKFRWFRPWVNEYGHAIDSSFTASRPKQEATITYKIPIDDPLYNYFSIQSGYKRLDQNDTDTEQYVVSFNRHWRLSNDWLRTVYIRYDKESGIQGQQQFSTELILPGISFSRTRGRGGINTVWGDKQLVYFEFANDRLFSSDNVIKLYAQNKIIRTYSGHQWVGMTEVGGIIADSIYDVPSSMRFFTGGDQSVRGFGYEEIAPRDGLDFLIGGSLLAVASLEYRYPLLDNWKLAVFGDVGTATDDFSNDFSMSTGGGIVWSSPVGPIRFYVAAPLTESEDKFKVHIMIGPEL